MRVSGSVSRNMLYWVCKGLGFLTNIWTTHRHTGREKCATDWSNTSHWDNKYLLKFFSLIPPNMLNINMRRYFLPLLLASEGARLITRWLNTSYNSGRLRSILVLVVLVISSQEPPALLISILSNHLSSTSISPPLTDTWRLNVENSESSLLSLMLI